MRIYVSWRFRGSVLYSIAVPGPCLEGNCERRGQFRLVLTIWGCQEGQMVDFDKVDIKTDYSIISLQPKMHLLRIPIRSLLAHQRPRTGNEYVSGCNIHPSFA